MNKKKTIITWILIIIFLGWALQNIYYIITTLLNLSELKSMYSNQAIIYVPLVFAVILLVIESILLYKLYFVKKDAVTWLRIVFILVLFSAMINVGLEFSAITEVNGGERPFLSEVTVNEFMNVFGKPENSAYVQPMVKLIITVMIIFSIWLAGNFHLRRAEKEKLMDFS